MEKLESCCPQGERILSFLPEEEMQSLRGSAGQQNLEQWLLQSCSCAGLSTWKAELEPGFSCFQLARGCANLNKFMKVMSGPP